MSRNNNEKKRFIKFALVGISGTVVDFSFFNIFIFFGLKSITSSVFSFIIAVLNNFIWNRNWTYPETRSKSFSSQFLKFGGVSIAGLLIRTVIYNFIEPKLINLGTSLFSNDFIFSPILIGKNISLAFVILIVLFWNYYANKMWTYKGLLEE